MPLVQGPTRVSKPYGAGRSGHEEDPIGSPALETGWPPRHNRVVRWRCRGSRGSTLGCLCPDCESDRPDWIAPNSRRLGLWRRDVATVAASTGAHRFRLGRLTARRGKCSRTPPERSATTPTKPPAKSEQKQRLEQAHDYGESDPESPPADRESESDSNHPDEQRRCRPSKQPSSS